MSIRIHGSADFTKVVGRIKPGQHGSNSAPDLGGHSLNTFEEPYREMGFAYSRTHDWPLWNEGQRMVDTHFVFPLMKLDPSDPTNYYFKPTDALIKFCQDAGSKIFYRLGTSIEHTSREKSLHFNTIPPDDFAKYAEVLAGIVRHYTRGWADGFRYDIRHWEIWNEPDLGPKMWTGSREEFCEFFAVVLKRLKGEFPELSFGGPGLCSIRTEWIDALLESCRRHDVKPDFISWHSYTDDVTYMADQPVFMRDYLDERGYADTKLVLDEWHYIMEWTGVQSSASPVLRRRAIRGPAGINEIDGAAFNVAALSEWQKGPLDIGCYYGASIYSTCFGWYNDDNELNKSFHSMRLFGDVTRECGDIVETSSNRIAPHQGGTYLLGAYAKDRASATLLVSDYRGSDEVLEIDVKGIPPDAHADVRVLDERHDLAPAKFLWHDGRLTLVKNDHGSAVFVVGFDLR